MPTISELHEQSLRGRLEKIEEAFCLGTGERTPHEVLMAVALFIEKNYVLRSDYNSAVDKLIAERGKADGYEKALIELKDVKRTLSIFVSNLKAGRKITNSHIDFLRNDILFTLERLGLDDIDALPF